MTTALQLYGFLILTFLGFIVPILAVLLSLFPEGSKALYAKSENERKQSEESIIKETKKKETEKGLDYAALEETIKTLRRRKRQAETRLEYLKPNRLITKIGLPFALAFVAVLLAVVDISQQLTILAVTLSLIGFALGLKALFASVSVLVEVSEIVNEGRRGTDGKIVELLSTLVEESGVEKLFLKEDKVSLQLNNKPLKKGEALEFSANRRYEVPTSIVNDADIMAKKVEVGLVLPKDFLVEKSPSLSIFTGEDRQIVRFNSDVIHAHEKLGMGKMGVTFLRAGEFEVAAFIKGENVRYQRFSLKLRVIE